MSGRPTQANHADDRAPQGTFFLVVGPSGAGKDSLIAAARQTLKDDARVIFARRSITRPSDAGGEHHEALSEQEFARKRDAGAFCLHWQAHGLFYGLPSRLEAELAAGRSVVANVSRAVIPSARARFQRLRILLVTASPAVLRERLRLRGRENAADIDLRLARALQDMPEGSDVVTVTNETEFALAAESFITKITEVFRAA